MPLYKSSDLSVHARAPCGGSGGQGRPDDPRQNRACRGRHGLTTGLRAEPGKDSQQLVQTAQPGWRLRLLCVGMSCWGPGETSPRLRADLVSKDMWPPASSPRHRSWVGGGVCHPVLGPGKEPWVERLWELSRGAGAAGGAAGGQQAPCSCSRGPSHWLLTATDPHLPTLQGPRICFWSLREHRGRPCHPRGIPGTWRTLFIP